MDTPGMSPDAAVYVISVAAELSGLHPQTLRSYERMGLIMPGRTGGGGRRYSHRDIELLREIASLTAGGVGIEGVRRILELEHQVAALQARNDGAGRRARGDPRGAPRRGDHASYRPQQAAGPPRSPIPRPPWSSGGARGPSGSRGGGRGVGTDRTSTSIGASDPMKAGRARQR